MFIIGDPVAGRSVRSAKTKNLEINLANKPSAHGVLMTNPANFIIYETEIRDVAVIYPAGRDRLGSSRSNDDGRQFVRVYLNSDQRMRLSRRRRAFLLQYAEQRF